MKFTDFDEIRDATSAKRHDDDEDVAQK